MARVLELLDETGSTSKPTGDTATLEDDGKVIYKGDGVKIVMSRWLINHSASDVFDKLAGWSNGYVTLQERR